MQKRNHSLTELPSLPFVFLLPPPDHFISGLEHKRLSLKLLPFNSINRFNQMVKVETVPFPVSASNEITSSVSC